MHWKVLAPLHFVTYACGCGARLPCIPGCVHVMLVQKVSWCMQRLHLQVILLLCLESAILLPLNYIRATGAHKPRQNGEPRQPRHLDTSTASTPTSTPRRHPHMESALTDLSTDLDTNLDTASTEARQPRHLDSQGSGCVILKASAASTWVELLVEKDFGSASSPTDSYTFEYA